MFAGREFVGFSTEVRDLVCPVVEAFFGHVRLLIPAQHRGGRLEQGNFAGERTQGGVGGHGEGQQVGEGECAKGEALFQRVSPTQAVCSYFGRILEDSVFKSGSRRFVAPKSGVFHETKLL